MLEEIREIFKRRELLWILIKRNLTIRYKNSALGFFWSLLTPVLMILVYVVFASILKFNSGRKDYLQFLVAGIVIWQFTAGCLNDSLYSIAGNSNLVKKVFFPRVILPVSTALANGVNFLLTFVILLLFLAVTGAADLSRAYWLIPAISMHLILGVGIACLCATANVFFRDMQHLVGIGSLAWFFLSPVFYDLELQTGIMKFGNPQLGGIVFLNPMSGILAAYRAGIMNYPLLPEAAPGVALNPLWLLLSAGVCAGVAITGILALRLGDKYFGDVL